MAFRHVVMFRWEDSVDADHIEAVRNGLSALPAEIEEIRSYVHGSDAGIGEGNFDYVCVADFDDMQAYITYRDHPKHQQLIQELIRGHVAERAAVQYEYDAD